jgi:hypothetical protein
MNGLSRKFLRLALFLGAFLVLPGLLPAQETPPPAAAALRTNSMPVRMPPGPFLVPPNQSPVDLFRQLLAVKSLERLKLLAGRPPATVKQILAKVREYQSLNPSNGNCASGPLNCAGIFGP